MTHQAVDPDAVERLRRRLGRSPGAPVGTHPPNADGTTGANVADPSDAADQADSAGSSGSSARVRSVVRRVGAPVLGRARRELDQAVERDRISLQRQIDELRVEVAGLRAEHAAELAALREELGGPAGR